MADNKTLVVEVFREEGLLKMSVFEQYELALTLKHYGQHEFQAQEVSNLCREIASILNKVDKAGIIEPESVRNLKKTGRLLWDYLLTRQVKERLKNTQASDLILSLDEELINIPWELLYDGTNFLCLNFNLGRLVRTREESDLTRQEYRSLPGVLKMLILVNPTNDLKSAYLEGLNIKNQFDRKRKSVLIDFKSTNIDKLYVKKNLCDYDIVHFAGHCEYEKDNPDESGWVLSDGRLTASEITGMAATVSLPALIFSNACYSAGSSGLAGDCHERNYTLASAFLLSGVRHYIGAIRRIEDPLSLVFAKEFYSNLISGKPVGESIKLARLALIKEHGISSILWASYLLYGDPHFILFKPKVRPREHLSFKKIVYKQRKKLAIFCSGLIIMLMGVYIALWLPTINPSAYFLFLKDKKLFSEGRNEEVISLSSRIINKEPLFLPVYPLLAETYQKIGEAEKALKYYYDYALISEKKGDKRSLSCAYTGIGWSYHLSGRYDKAMEFYEKAIAKSREAGDKLNEAIAMRKMAVWQMDKKDYSKALELLTKSSEINLEKQQIFEHRYNLACDYFDIGLVFANKDDFPSAKEFYEKSRRLFVKLNMKKDLSDYYFNLGEIYVFEKEYHKAMDCYMTGLRIDKAQNNKMSLCSDLSMIGELYAQMDNFKEAESFFLQSIVTAKEINAQPELAGSCYSLGSLYKKIGKIKKAKEYFRLAQEIYSRIDVESYEEIKQELLAME
ncbi:MAG TPA: CHAT domain-containing protein [Candidatus Margulisiibacteriota bacterium]|nr:CHAT domain-containing protein [Candidatus Margulisiibacteriota bacterium]